MRGEGSYLLSALESLREEFGQVPTKNIVCPSCDGEGSYVNPAIDGHGISADEFYYEWGDEEQEMYLTGGYDVTCDVCLGRNVVTVLDTERVSPDIVAFYDDYIGGALETDAIMRAEERMMGYY